MKVMPRLLIMVFLTFCFGCGLTTAQRTAIKNFGEATSKANDIAKNELTNMRNESIDMNLQWLAFKYSRFQEEMSKEEFIKKLHHPDPQKDKYFILMEKVFENPEAQLTLENVQIRVEAADVLQNYGNLLEKLTDDSSTQQVSQAIGNLFSSLDKLPKDFLAVDSSQLNVIGKAVQAMGRLLVDAKKKKVIRMTVPAFHPQVEILCDLLAADFNPYDAKGEISSQLLRITQDLQTELVHVHRTTKSLLERSIAMRARKSTKINQDYIDHYLSQVSQSFQKMKKAHEELKNKLESDDISFEDIKKFVDNVKDIVNLSKLFKIS